MTSRRGDFLCGAAIGLQIGLVLAIAIACEPSQPPVVVATEQAEIAAYAAEEQECVTLAPTRAGADACIQGVRDRWCAPGQPLAAAGACGDGGTVVAPESGPPMAAAEATLNAMLDARAAAALATGAGLPPDAGAPQDGGGQ